MPPRNGSRHKEKPSCSPFEAAVAAAAAAPAAAAPAAAVAGAVEAPAAVAAALEAEAVPLPSPGYRTSGTGLKSKRGDCGLLKAVMCA